MTAVLVALLFAVSVAQAGDNKAATKALLQKAQAKASTGAASEAAALFGEAIALSQKDGDLEAEQAAADPFLLFLKAQSAKGDVTGLLSAAAGKLDPEGLRAFVSAPSLAWEILVGVAAGRNEELLKQANAILECHSDSPKAGIGLHGMALLARGMVSARTGDVTAAAESLRKAQETFVKEEWTDLVLVAAIERAAFHVRAGQVDEATKVVIGVCAHFDSVINRDSILDSNHLPPHLLEWWKAAIAARLKECPEKVLVPWTAWQGYAKNGAPPKSEKGKSVSYEGAGPGGRTALATYLAKAKPGSTVATVKRKGFWTYIVMWDPKTPMAISHVEGQIVRNYGGLGVAFSTWSIAVAKVDLRVLRDHPADQSTTDVGRAWYRLGRDETWALAKDGSVSITK